MYVLSHLENGGNKTVAEVIKNSHAEAVAHFQAEHPEIPLDATGYWKATPSLGYGQAGISYVVSQIHESVNYQKTW